VAAHANRPPAAIAEAILASARAFGPQTDDQTLLVILRLSGAPPDATGARISAAVEA
jgi:hypothetical protein